MVTIQWEARFNQDRSVWSWFSGITGTNNDLNIPSHSTLLQNLFNDQMNLRVSRGYK